MPSPSLNVFVSISNANSPSLNIGFTSVHNCAVALRIGALVVVPVTFIIPLLISKPAPILTPPNVVLDATGNV